MAHWDDADDGAVEFDQRPALRIPGLYAKQLAAFAAPAAVDDRFTMAIDATDDAYEQAALIERAESQRQADNARARAELAERKRSLRPFRLARWRVIDRAVRDTGAEVASREYTEYEVGLDDVVRPVAKGYGVHREEWSGGAWVPVPSIAPHLAELDAALPPNAGQD